MKGNAFYENSEVPKNLSKLEQEGREIEAAIKLVNILRPHDAGGRARIVKRVQETLGCKDVIATGS